MATSLSFVEYVCEQFHDIGEIRYRKMFGEYMVYVNDKPIILICDDTVFVKKLDSISSMMNHASIGYPYKGAKEHYILDIDNVNLAKEVITKLENVTPLPKKKNKK